MADIPDDVTNLYELLQERLKKNGSFSASDLQEVLSTSGLLPSSTPPDPEVTRTVRVNNDTQELRNNILNQQLEQLTKLTRPIGVTTVSAADQSKEGSFAQFFNTPFDRSRTAAETGVKTSVETFESKLAAAASRIGIKDIGETPEERRNVLQTLTADRLSRGRANIGIVKGIDFQSGPAPELLAASQRDPRSDAAYAQGYLTEMNGKLSGADVLPRIESLSGRPKTPLSRKKKREDLTF